MPGPYLTTTPHPALSPIRGEGERSERGCAPLTDFPHSWGRSTHVHDGGEGEVRREGVTREIAEEIAMELSGRCQDVRDAVRVARLGPQLGIDKAIRLLLN